MGPFVICGTVEMGRSYRAVLAILAEVRPSVRGGLALRVAIAVAVAALAGATAGLLPAVMGVALDSLVARGAPRPVTGLAAAFAALVRGAPAWGAILAALLAALVVVAVAVTSSRLGSELSGDVTAALRVALFRAVISASPRDVDEAGRASVAARTPPPGAAPPGKAAPVVRGTEIVKLAIARESGLAAELVVALLTGLPQALATLAVLAWELARGGAGIVLAGGAGLFVLSRIAADRASRRVGAAMTHMSEADAAVFSELGETLASTEELYLTGARGEAVRDFAAAADRAAAARRSFAGALAVSGQIKSVFSALGPLLILVALTLSRRAGEPGKVAELMLVIPLLMARLEALDGLRAGLVEREPLLASITRLLALPAAPPAAKDTLAASALGAGAIVFDGVRFTPRGAPKPVLDGLSLTIPAGALVGVCGRSGSGKSTILRVLLRLDDPDEGAVTIDGVDVRRLDPREIPRVFAVLGQASRLFERSVARNLALGLDPPPDMAAMREALAQVEFDALTGGGDRGLDTVVRAVPPNFSGGEQRRLLLARALLRDARVLVIDEPEAGLPSATAEAILARVKDLGRGRTTIVVTHAPHLLRSAFNVVIDAGKVAAVGTHDELVEKSETYRALLAEGLKRRT
jgi:ABC-type multidrug transport system fused ATPase/permease subunit